MSEALVEFPDSSSKRRTTTDLTGLMGVGIDDVVISITNAIRTSIEEDRHSTRTLHTYLGTCALDWLPWLSAASAAKGAPLTLDDINEPLISAFAADLRRKYNYTTAAKKYDQVIGVLRILSALGYVRSVAEIRPPNPFPRGHIAQTSTTPYSKRERSEILAALAVDLQRIRNGDADDIGDVEAIVIYFLLIAFRSGFNTSPLLVLGRDALASHPLRKDMWVLTSYKRRAFKDVQATTRWSEELAMLTTVGTDLVVLYRELLDLTSTYLNDSSEETKAYAFIRPPLLNKSGERHGPPIVLTTSDVSGAVSRISRRHCIETDKGSILRITTKKIRATLASRAFELSGGDPFVVAKILCNKPRTSDLHYTAPPPDAEVDFSKAVESLEARLRKPAPDFASATPVSLCTDPLHGRYAPKDGVSYCQRWLHCFKCPNQCLNGTDDDLWRLYSFYWLLQANAQRIRRMPIAGMFRLAIHVMENTIPAKFGKRAEAAKLRARTAPHPFWARVREKDILFLETHDAR